MDSNSLAKGGSLGVDGISLIQMVVFKCNNLVQKLRVQLWTISFSKE